MEGFAFYALIGLLLLVPLEIFFLIIAAASTRKRDLVQKIVLPSQKQQERYGWEGMLKLSPERTPSRSHNYFLAALIIVLLLVVVAAPGLFLVAPSIHINLSRQSANDTTLTPPVEVNETAGSGIFSNLTFPGLNTTVPRVNLSGIFVPLRANIKAVASGLAAVVVAVLVLFFIIRRRKLAVVTKAGKIAEKLMRKAKEGKKKKSPEVRGALFSGLSSFRRYVAPAVILFLLLIMAFLVYLLRERIRGLARDVISFLVLAKEFAANYRFYILAGFIMLAALLLLLRNISKRSQKPL